MSDVLQERTFVQPRNLNQIIALVNTPGGCFDLYRVQHRVTFLSTDGMLQICWFEAPDAEALRSALRKMDVDSSGIWSGAAHATPGLTRSDLVAGNVLVERVFDTPLQVAASQELHHAGAADLAQHQVEILLSFLSRDGKRALCAFRAPDIDSVRAGLRQAKLPFGRVWPIHTVCATRASWPNA